MGYTTNYTGSVKVHPPLNQQEIKYLRAFADTRHVRRHGSEYEVGYDGMLSTPEPADIIDYNRPPDGVPGLWCSWTVSDDGTEIYWDGSEKFYQGPEWMQYLIDNFLKHDCHALGKVPGIVGGHVCNGTLQAQGEQASDRWQLVVTNNAVTVHGRKRHS